ncbi:Rio2, N-terminal-domain-containing protein [Microdochium trichocladiopsis]|uniref:Serine/threonine-protein kinase RIO2 n=1 Tax=Microdochium trichocladiopsis TaxID=1682393 RepID=A0A9P8Y6G3_9PEZI|nr:Rio2, N-terminal-domain-containing protein [Microdochium trichocladiopsis]KAH7030837.1 Rio2, N-terminal-domain-containing protein [Microdochium trichocladiopsis]
MKLDSKAMRHLTADDWRVLQAVEQGSKNHELVPTPLIEKIARLRGGAGSTRKSISALAKVGLIARVKEAKYDGYRLTYGGLDYLALHTYASRKHIYSVGTRIGVGKESDIMIVADDTGAQKVLKIHRLGRISFRTVKSNRDYLRKRQGGSWMYLSRLAAEKEFAFMKALRDEGFLVPEPISQSRHTILMDLIDAFPLRQISQVPDPAALYAELIAVILRLAKHGLIHGDFNEFNILLKEEREQQQAAAAAASSKGKDAESAASSSAADQESSAKVTVTPIIIDFPQMVSMDHVNAEMYFDRDVACIKRFFERRFHFVATEPGPFFKDAKKTVGKDGATRLDATVAASGFTKKMLKDLEAAIREQQEGRGEGGEDETARSDGDEDGYDEPYGSDDGEEQEEGEDEAEDNMSGPRQAEVDQEALEKPPHPQFEKLAISDT